MTTVIPTDREFVFEVSVRLRDGVRDPAIDAVAEAVSALSLPIRPLAAVRTLRVAVRSASADDARRHVEVCATALLVNPTLETFDITLASKT